MVRPPVGLATAAGDARVQPRAAGPPLFGPLLDDALPVCDELTDARDDQDAARGSLHALLIRQAAEHRVERLVRAQAIEDATGSLFELACIEIGRSRERPRQERMHRAPRDRASLCKGVSSSARDFVLGHMTTLAARAGQNAPRTKRSVHMGAEVVTGSAPPTRGAPTKCPTNQRGPRPARAASKPAAPWTVSFTAAGLADDSVRRTKRSSGISTRKRLGTRAAMRPRNSRRSARHK